MKRLYIIGPGIEDDHYDLDEYTALAATLAPWYDVIPRPTHWSRGLDIASLLTCDAAFLIDTWWTSLHATVLQGVATYVGIEIVNEVPK